MRWVESTRALRIVLSLWVALECLYVVSFSPFPSVDGAAHLGSAWAIADQLRGGSFADLFTWHFAPPPPNTLPSFALVACAQLLGYQHAETLLIAGYVVGLPWALWFALSRLRRDNQTLAFFALPLTFSLSLLYGFLNFSWSLVVLLTFAGVLLSERELSPKRALLHFVLLLALYGTHFVGWLIGALMYGCFALHRRSARALLLAGAALTPSAVMVAWFLLQSRSAPAELWVSPLTKLARLALFDLGQLGYEKSERVAFVTLALLFWTLVVRARRRERDPRVLILLATIAGASALAVFGPEGTSSGAVQLAPRLGSIAALLGVLALGGCTLQARERAATALVCSIAALYLVVVRDDSLRAIERAQRSLLSLAPDIRPRSTLLQANLERPRYGTTGRLDPLTAETGRLAAARDLLDLPNVDLALPYFVLRFEPAFNPWLQMVIGDANIEESPPPLDLGYAAKTHVPIDYVVLLGRTLTSPEQRADPGFQAFEAQLRAGFTHARTTDDQLWELWRAR